MSDRGEDPFGWVGATLDGKYQVDAVVGRGGFGVVYRAQHLGFDEKVAIKCLRIPKTLNGIARDQFERDFLAEGRLLHQLSRATAGIVQALDVGALVSPNKTWTPFIVLEWLDGEALDAHFAERRRAGLGGRGLREAVELLDSAARALALAHEQGIAHRDIKPANLFLAEVGGRTTLKVLDFGIAKVVSESESFSQAFEETGAAPQAFTTRYGSPEQFSRRYGATGPWSDVFSLALVFVEAVVGHSALEGVDAAQLFIAAADTTRRPTLRTHGIDPGDAVEHVLSVALAVDPKQRYPNAGEFWDALLAAVASTGGALRALPHVRADSNGPELVADPESATRLDSSRTSTSDPNPSQRSPTSSQSLPGPTAILASHSSRSQRIQRIVAALILVVIFGGGLALWLGRAPTFTAEGVSAKQVHPPAGSVKNGSNGELGAAPPVRPIDSAITASAAPGPSGAPGFAGLPARDVAAGFVSDNGAWIDRFSVLRRDDTSGLELTQAFARCLDAGKALCTEPQWQRACTTLPEVGETASWTDGIEDGRAIVRGGGSCAARKLDLATDRDPKRIGLCCDRAVAMSSTSLQKPFLSSTAGVVLKLERALNQRSIDAFLELSEDHVVLNDHPRDKPSLRALLSQSFAAARDLVIVNAHCDVSVSSKKVVLRRSRRVKKTSYETTGWSALCQQTRHRDGKALNASSRYEFSALSKLRAINDTETQPAAE